MRPGKILRRCLTWFSIIIFGILTLFIIGCLVFDHFIQFRMSDEQLLTFFSNNQIKGEVRYYHSHGRDLRYVSVGEDSLPALLFIHGSPSSISIYRDYFDDSVFIKKFKMYAVDRPGYGYSGLGNPEPSIQKQAAMIQPILTELNKIKRPVIIVASSYGTSVACRLVMDNPGLVDGLVLVAPSLAPGQEKTYWFTPIIENPFIRWFIPRMFRSANTEKIHHKNELMAMMPYWGNIHIPVMYMQGAKDQLVYTSNADFAKKQLVNASYLDIKLFPGRPHFIPFSERPTIRKKILLMLELLQNRK